MKKQIVQFFAIGIAVAVWLPVFSLVGLIRLQTLDASTVSAIEPADTAHSEVSANVDEQLSSSVTPAEGVTLPVKWGNMGRQLVEVGAIDLAKFERQYGELSEEQLQILQGDDLQEIRFTPNNIQFWTNVLWSLGLTQQSQVLGEGPMTERASEVPIANYASTAGWTLGSKPATELFNSQRLIDLTPEQDELVQQVAATIFRPCCGNHTGYPDCNHGMAVLGLMELMASQGATEDELYRAALAFNRYAFPSQYAVLATYFLSEGTPWADVDAVTVLGADYSSARGFQQILAQVQPPEANSRESGGCST